MRFRVCLLFSNGPKTQKAGTARKSRPGPHVIVMLVLFVLTTPALHAPSYGVNAQLRAARSVRMLTLEDEVDEKAMLVWWLSTMHAVHANARHARRVSVAM